MASFQKLTHLLLSAHAVLHNKDFRCQTACTDTWTDIVPILCCLNEAEKGLEEQSKHLRLTSVVLCFGVLFLLWYFLSFGNFNLTHTLGSASCQIRQGKQQCV